MSVPVPVITVDGPSGVGKGMVSRGLARQLQWHRLDSGALYRILALAAVKRGVELDDFEGVAQLAPALDIRFTGETEDDEAIWVNGENLTASVRAETTGGLASRIAAAPLVRAALLQRQHDFRSAPGLIADGRDMGTVVFPDADLKLFLTASAEERARRRAHQLSKQGRAVIFADLCQEIRERDERDRSRSIAPLVPAVDALVIDTTLMSPPEVFKRIGEALEASGIPCHS